MRNESEMRETFPTPEDAKRDAAPFSEEGPEEGRVVKNRDVILMCRIFEIMQDIISLENRSDWQYERLFSITRRLNGMPGGGGLPQGMEGTIADVQELNERYGERLKNYVRALKEAEKILNAMPESMQTFVRMYYIDGLSRAEVMRDLNMTKWAFDHARESIENAECMAKVRWREKFSTR